MAELEERMWIRFSYPLPIYWSNEPGDQRVDALEKALVPSSMLFLCDQSMW